MQHQALNFSEAHSMCVAQGGDLIDILYDFELKEWLAFSEHYWLGHNLNNSSMCIYVAKENRDVAENEAACKEKKKSLCKKKAECLKE